MAKTKKKEAKKAKKPVVVKAAKKPVKAAKPAVVAKPAKKAAKTTAIKKDTPKKVAPVAAKAASSKPPKEDQKLKKPATKIEDDEAPIDDDFEGSELDEYAEEIESVEVEVTRQPAREIEEPGSEVILTDAEGRRYCRLKDCDQIAMVEGYCRYHYLLFWKKIQVRKKILSEGKLGRYIDELTSRYPDKYLEMIRKDLKTEKDFLAAIQELEIDDSGVDNEYEDEAQSYIEEVRGMSSETPTREDEEF